MKLLLATVLFCLSLGNATASITTSALLDKNVGTDKEKKKESEDKTSRKKNIHSVKKWKMTIQYTNGSVISKTIVVQENSKLSALETAFAEADKYLGNKKNVKEYSISPVTDTYVLLAGD